MFKKDVAVLLRGKWGVNLHEVLVENIKRGGIENIWRKREKVERERKKSGRKAENERERKEKKNMKIGRSNKLIEMTGDREQQKRG